MNQKQNNLKFEKEKNNDSNSNLNPQIQKEEIIKSKIMKKYNVSYDDANKILFELKRKKIIKSNSESNNKINTSNIKNSQEIPNINKSDEKIVNENNYQKLTNASEMSEKREIDSEVVDSTHQKDDLNSLNNDSRETNVDSILEDIVPDYNKQISIKVDHVDLTFEVQTEKVDTLKETFIRTVKRTKSKKTKIHALKDISFQIYKGEKVGIIGYNGAGKSTLLNVITGIYPVDSGKVTTQGRISPLLALGAGFDQNFSGRKNIMLNGAVLGYDKKFLESKMDEIIEFSELGEFIDLPIKNYSSGMLAKLGFSIATTVNPDILIIDEILGVGDVNFKKKSAHKIRSLMDGGTTVLLVSHSIPQIRELCDKAIWIDKGNLRDIGEVNKICDEYLEDAKKASSEQLANIKLVN